MHLKFSDPAASSQILKVNTLKKKEKVNLLLNFPLMLKSNKTMASRLQ